MTDAVPELWEQISRDFNRSASTDVWIRSFLRRVKDGTATSEEASVYAGRLGTHAGSALARALKKESLPDGKLYWNIADRVRQGREKAGAGDDPYAAEPAGCAQAR